MSLYSATILRDTPTAYLRLGTGATDSSGNGYNGTAVGGVSFLQGGALSKDSDGSALFDGSTGYITLPSVANTYGWSAFSVEFWGKLSVSVGSYLRAISQTSATSTNTGWEVRYIASAGGIEFDIGNGTVHASATYLTAITINAWNYIVATYDGVTARLYVNNVAHGTAALAGTIGTGSPVINLGRDASFNNNYFHGDLDEVAIYHSVLSLSQINDHWNAAQSTPKSYQVAIGGVLANVVAGTLTANNTIGQRSTLSCTAWDATGALTFDQGTQIQLYDTSNTLIYGGYIEADKIVKPGFSALLEHQLTCKDYHYLADKLLAARSHLNQTAGSIVIDLINNYLSSEGVTFTSASIAAGATLPEVVFNYEQVSKCIDAMATQTGYWWQIDTNKVLWFQPYGGQNAPFVLDGTTVSQDDKLAYENGNPQYVNRQFVTGGWDKTGLQTETRHGDGVSRAFAFSYQFSTDVPTVTVNGVGQTVAVKGAQTGYQWYYAEGDQTLAQDTSGTILISSDTLIVTYKGRYPVVALAQNNTLITTQQSLEGGGTGYVESKYHNAKVKSLAAAFQIGSSLLAHYGQKMRTLTWAMKAASAAGLLQGQLLTVNLTALGLTHVSMLIQSVEYTDSIDGINMWCVLTAVGSPYDVTWQTFFQNLANQQQPQDAINVGDGGVLAILTQWSALWNWAASYTATKNTCPIIGNSTIIGPSLIIC